MSKAHTLPKSEKKKNEQKKEKEIGKWEVENEELGLWVEKKMHLHSMTYDQEAANGQWRCQCATDD